MTAKPTIWQRVVRFFVPETETYETRPARSGEPGAPLTTQHYEATDRRRHGGSADIGG